MSESVGPAEARRRKMFVFADELGLTRDDRIDLASMLLRRTMTSWSELDEDQVIRILDALEGHQLLGHLEATRPPSAVEQVDDGDDRQQSQRRDRVAQ